MATTTNFGWETPDDTDLVKDGAAAMRTLGNSIDTSLVDLKGGTIGQILSKASNTDLDYTWVSPNPGDITAVNAGTGISGGGTSGDVTITNSMATAIDAKGDLIVGTGDNTFIRQAIGSNGQTLIADSSQTDGLQWGDNYGFTAGKNKIINGNFGIWQRGTSFSNPSNGTYTADRWFVELDGSGYTRTISQQTFTPGTAPVAGYEGQYFLRWNNSVAGTGNTINAISTRLEDIRTLAGQTVTFSFWAKADASRALTVYAYQQSTGGSGTVTTTLGTATLTTSWARYTMTASLPSLSGVTIGTNSNLQIRVAMPTGVTMTCDFWGMQLEAGSVSTPFQTATGNPANELAACQRYYYRVDGTTATIGTGYGKSTTVAQIFIPFKSTMRTNPTAIDYANTAKLYDGVSLTNGTSMAIYAGLTGKDIGCVEITVASGLTQYRPYSLITDGSSAAYVAFTAEL